MDASLKEQLYWTQRYHDGSTGWDIGYPSTPLKEYVDQLKDKSVRILIPGAGNGYEAQYLYEQGFKNVFVLDISEVPLNSLHVRCPSFPEEQLLHDDFFSHAQTYDLILEQTFFCSFLPTEENRNDYAHQMASLLRPGGKLVGLWFDIPLREGQENRPFGGNRELYVSYLSPVFEVITFEKAHNSIPEREGNELFGIFRKAR